MFIKKKKKYNFKTSHSFVVMTGGDPKYIDKCVNSLKHQRLKSNIIIYTSRTSKKIKQISKKYKIRLITKKRHVNVATDWNNALNCTSDKWVTLVHDDDIYHKNYFLEVKNVINKNKNLSIIFTNYLQIKNNKIQKINILLIIKKILLFFGFFGKKKIYNKILKKTCLAFGSPIPCPSVTFNKRKSKKFFNVNYNINLDWDCWLNLADNNGAFFWIRKNLFFHRIHQSTITSIGIKTGLRKKEDQMILLRIWPRIIASIILRLYNLAYYSNLK
jgi:hypothetical protein